MEAVRENLTHLHPLHLAPVDVGACAEAAVRSASVPEGVTVELQDLDVLPTVVAGQRSLTLVFANLFQNAAEAMQGHGRITVRGATEGAADSSGAWVQIAVHDDGPGIEPELHDRIFEFDFSRSARSRAGSLGFGLWWVKSLMVRLGGSVTVESDGQHGTTFYLRLPREGRRTTDDA